MSDTVPGLQYATDALSTVPLVILSRIRRTADPQVLLIQAFALYASFLTAAWFKDASLLQAQWGLLRLAIPPGMALLGLILEDAYTTPGRRSPLKLLRGPLLGFGLAVGSQAVFRAGKSDLALPSWIMVYAIRHEFAAVVRDPAVVSAGRGPATGCECARSLAQAGRRGQAKTRTALPQAALIAAIDCCRVVRS